MRSVRAGAVQVMLARRSAGSMQEVGRSGVCQSIRRVPRMPWRQGRQGRLACRKSARQPASSRSSLPHTCSLSLSQSASGKRIANATMAPRILLFSLASLTIVAAADALIRLQLPSRALRPDQRVQAGTHLCTSVSLARDVDQAIGEWQRSSGI